MCGGATALYKRQDTTAKRNTLNKITFKVEREWQKSVSPILYISVLLKQLIWWCSYSTRTIKNCAQLLMAPNWPGKCSFDIFRWWLANAGAALQRLIWMNSYSTPELVGPGERVGPDPEAGRNVPSTRRTISMRRVKSASPFEERPRWHR